MSGFAKYTSKDNFRLNERPTYRRGQGADPIKSFVARSYATYSQNADRIRDARFAKSNELNRDYAVRNKREQMLSEAYMTERDPVKLQGLHGRIKAKMSRSDGALSYALPYAYKTKFNDPRRNKRSGKSSARASQGSVQIMRPSANTTPVAPSATVASNDHSPPTVASNTDGAGAGKKKRLSADQRMAQENQLLTNVQPTITRQQSYTEMPPTQRQLTPEGFEEQQRMNAQSPNVRRYNSTTYRPKDSRQLFKQ